MTAVRATLALVLAALLLALPSAAQAQGNSVSGTINYNVRSALPGNAVVTMQIARITATGTSEVVYEQRLTTNGAQVPFRFVVPYDPARIDQNATYNLQGNISVNGQARFTTNRAIPVITRGNPTANLSVVMAPVGNLPNTSGGGTMILIAGLLAAGFVAVRLLRLRLSR